VAELDVVQGPVLWSCESQICAAIKSIFLNRQAPASCLCCAVKSDDAFPFVGQHVHNEEVLTDTTCIAGQVIPQLNGDCAIRVVYLLLFLLLVRTLTVFPDVIPDTCTQKL